MKNTAVTFLILFSVFTTHSQTEGQEILSAFDVQQAGDAVLVNFTIEAGISYCLGVDLERSNDGIQFESVVHLPGVCGGSEFEESYLLWDSLPPLNQLIYYRLDLGLIGKSETRIVRFVEFENGIRVFPNPSSGIVYIKTEELNSEKILIGVYDLYGKSVEVSSNSSKDEISINPSQLLPGTYFFSVQSGNTIRKGTFIVL